MEQFGIQDIQNARPWSDLCSKEIISLMQSCPTINETEIDIDIYDGLRVSKPFFFDAQYDPSAKRPYKVKIIRNPSAPFDLTFCPDTIDAEYSLTEARKFRHEIIGSSISGTILPSDKALSTWVKMSDEGDNMTPDFLFVNGNEVWILEITTSQSSNEVALIRRYKHKVLKYRQRILSRSQSYIVRFGVLVVSPTKLLCTSQIPDNLAELLCNIYDSSLSPMLTWNKDSPVFTFETDDFSSNKKDQLLTEISKLSSQGLNEPTKRSEITTQMMEYWDSIIEKGIESEASQFIPELISQADDALKKDLSEDSYDNIAVLNKFIKSMEDPSFRMEERESVCPWPMLIPKVDMDFSMLRSQITAEDLPDLDFSEIPESNLFRECFDNVSVAAFKRKPYKKKVKSAYSAESDLVKEKTTQKRSQKLFGKVRVRLDDEDTSYFRRRGWPGFGDPRKDEEAKEKKLDKKVPLSIKNDTSHVTDFLDSGKDSFSPMKGVSFPAWKRTKTLRNLSQKLSDSDGTSDSLIESILSTKIFNALSLWSLIVQEINLSSSTYTDTREFILKRIPCYNIWLVIKTLNQSKHMCVCVMAKADEFEELKGPFKSGQVEGEYIFFPSFTIDKFQRAHQLDTDLKMASHLLGWMGEYRVDQTSVANLHTSDGEDWDSIRRSFLLSTLVRLEGKRQTSSSLQIHRYINMKCLRGGGMPIRPCESLSKLDNRPKTILLIWYYQMLDEGLRILIARPPTLRAIDETGDEDQVSADAFDNLYSILQRKNVKNLSTILQESYLCQLINKDQGDIIQGYKDLFEKIAEQELLMRSCPDSQMGYGSDHLQDMKVHGFNATMALYSGQSIATYLEQRFGREFKKKIENDILQAAMENTETLATYKASGIEPTTHKFKEAKRSKDTTKSKQERTRQRALQGMLDLIEEDLMDEKPFTELSSLVQSLEEIGLYVNLFKKNQIGGTREIYVLSARGRVCINFVEKISRVLCSYLPCEMLTKGTEKINRTHQHYKVKNMYMRTKGLNREFTVTNSDDCKTWCQQFIMAYFGAVLYLLLPRDFFLVVARILNCVCNKMAELPTELLLTWIAHKNVVGFSPAMNQMKREFFGLEKDPVLIKKKGEKILHNESNMMQGILHFTSSLCHAGVVMTTERLLDQMVLLLKKNGSLSQESILHMTSKVSSDDSSMIITFLTDKREDERLGKYLSLLANHIKCKLYLFNCMRYSVEKSTSNCLTLVEEFNSNWMTTNSVELIWIKFTEQAVMNQVVRSLEGRQFMYSNARGQCLKNGIDASACHAIQVLQEQQHYRNFGSDTQDIFREFAKLLIKKPHPVFGFFLREPKLVCGMFGLDMAKHMARKHRDYLIVENYIYSTNEVDINEEGTPTYNLSIMIGNFDSYRSFLKNIRQRIPEELIEQAEQNPSWLYHNAWTKEELLHNILRKATSQSVIDVFNYASSSKPHAAAAYILDRPCIIKMTKLAKSDGLDLDENGRWVNRERVKVSLIRALAEEMDIVRLMPEEKLKTIFPLTTLFNDVEQIMEELKDTILVPRSLKRARLPIKIRVQKENVLVPISVFDCARKLWFPDVLGKVVQGSKTEHLDSWRYYCRVFPWLRDTERETLNESPFVDSYALMLFLKSLSKKDKTVEVLAQDQPGKPMLEQIRSLIIRHHMNGFILETPPTDKRTFRSDISSLGSTVFALSRSPCRKGELLPIVEKVFGSTRLILPDRIEEAILRLDGMRERDRFLALSQLVQRRVQDVELLIAKSKGVCFGFYTTKQKFNESNRRYVGKGVVEGLIGGEPFQINILDSSVTNIIVTSDYVLSENAKPFLDMLRAIGLNDYSAGVSDIPTNLFFNVRRAKISNSSSPTSIPIVVNTSLLSEISFEDTQIRLGLNNNNLPRILIQFPPTKKRRETVTCELMSLSPHKWNYSQASLDLELVDGELQRYWLESKFRDRGELKLRVFENMRKTSDYDSWLVQSLKLRARYRHKIKSVEETTGRPDRILVSEEEAIKLSANIAKLDFSAMINELEDSASDSNSESDLEESDQDKITFEESLINMSMSEGFSVLDNLFEPGEKGYIPKPFTNQEFLMSSNRTFDDLLDFLHGKRRDMFEAMFIDQSIKVRRPSPKDFVLNLLVKLFDLRVLTDDEEEF
jgi:hypothetical protein